MENITIYQKPTCTTCRKVYAALKESGVDFKSVDYYLESIPKEKIKDLLAKMNISAEELLREKENVYQELGLAEEKVSEEKLIDFMVAYPDLIQRPIVEKGTKAILARPAERIIDFLK